MARGHEGHAGRREARSRNARARPSGRCCSFTARSRTRPPRTGRSPTSNFFERVRGLYGDRIYAFDHFTLSRTPEENARMLLEGLPDKTFTFDVITHSRGGLVLRNLVERSAAFGPLAKRFKLGRAVLVASPNEGTPLATPGRWEDTVGWMAEPARAVPRQPVHDRRRVRRQRHRLDRAPRVRRSAGSPLHGRRR